MYRVRALFENKPALLTIIGALILVVSIFLPIWKMTYPGYDIEPVFGSLWTRNGHEHKYWGISLLALSVLSFGFGLWRMFVREKWPAWIEAATLMALGFAMLFLALIPSISRDLALTHKLGMRVHYGFWIYAVGAVVLAVGVLWSISKQLDARQRMSLLLVFSMLTGFTYALRASSPVPLPPGIHDTPKVWTDGFNPTKENNRRNDVQRVLNLMQRAYQLAGQCKSLEKEFGPCTLANIYKGDKLVLEASKKNDIVVELVGEDGYLITAKTKSKPVITFKYNSGGGVEGSRTCSPPDKVSCKNGHW